MAQTTRIAIRKGFLELLEQRPLDKISVVDIAEHCGVNRNTFYYYYCDIYALVREVLDTELDSVLNAHLYRSNQRDLLENEYYQVAYRAVEGLIRRTAAGLPAPEEDIRALSALYTATLVGILQSWLHNGMKSDEEQFLRRISDLTEGTLRRTLERSCGEDKA